MTNKTLNAMTNKKLEDMGWIKFRVSLGWWIGFLVITLLLGIFWIIDSRLYDKDLERDHISETGHGWID